MKKLLLLTLVLFFSVTSMLSGQWVSSSGPEGVSNYSALFKDGNTFWAPTQGGLFFSTDDGNTWQNHPDILRDDYLVNLVRKDNFLFAVARGLNGPVTDYQHHLYKSENNGVTWEQTNTPGGLDELNLPSIGVVNNYLMMFENGTNIYRSNDDGLTWETLNLPVDYYSNLIHDEKHLVFRSYPEGVFLSSDAGSTWQIIGDSAQQFTDIYLLKDSIMLGHSFPDNVSTYVYSPDLGQHWLEMDSLPGNANYERFLPGTGDTIFLKNGDTFFSVNKGKSWNYYGNEDAYLSPFLRTADGGALRYEYPDIEKYSSQTHSWSPSAKGLLANTILKFVSNEDYVFAIGENNKIFRKSVQEGSSWQELSLNIQYLTQANLAISNDTLYISEYNIVYQITDNGNGLLDTLVSGYGGFYAEDLSVQGQFLVLTQSNKIFIANRFTGTIQSITTFPSPSGLHNHFLRIIGNRWVYTNNSGSAYISENQGASWIETFEQFLPGNNWWNKLYFINNRLYFVTRNHIAISTDYGSSWTTTTSGLPINSDGDLSQLYDMAASGNLLFAVTYWRGVYVSTDFGITWKSYNQGLPRQRGYTLTATNGRLYMGTFNASAYERNIQIEGLNGLVYGDINNNGVRDAGEQPVPNIIIKSEPDEFFSKSGNDGTFTALANSSDSIKVVAPSPYVSIKPNAYKTGQVQNGNYQFGLYYPPNINDLRIALTLNQPLVAGFERVLLVTCSNVGTTALEPKVIVIIPQPLNFIAGLPAPATISGDSILYELGTLPPQQTVTLSITVMTPVTVGIGEIFSFEGTINPIAGDEVPGDNYAALRETIVGSFDPNDKSVSPNHYFTPEQLTLGERLIYTIRFQNTGNYPATFVRIVDTLQQSLDPGSIQILAYSHEMTWNLGRDNVVEFLFDNINLPDSTNDEPNSHGFVQFGIKPKTDLPLGSSIKNRAFIYFDYNTPIETNTVSNVFDFINATLQSKMHPLDIYPNPTTGLVIIQRPRDAWAELRLFDQTGKLILSNNVFSAKETVDLTQLPAGIYWAMIHNKDRAFVGKIVLSSKGNR